MLLHNFYIPQGTQVHNNVRPDRISCRDQPFDCTNFVWSFWAYSYYWCRESDLATDVQLLISLATMRFVAEIEPSTAKRRGTTRYAIAAGMTSAYSHYGNYDLKIWYTWESDREMQLRANAGIINKWVYEQCLSYEVLEWFHCTIKGLNWNMPYKM